MAIPSYLNDQGVVNTDDFADNPIEPASEQAPLTIPDRIQLAEYGEGDFYVAHSDNSWTDESPSAVRSNFRHYTCILYANDDWKAQDGGALRIYPETQHLYPARQALERDDIDYVDVMPKNGRLLVFDSCLVHSVEPVTCPEKVRRAFTLWVTRPNDSGVQGEIYY
jgi:Rps23 Pro-64 3,4-dihydroxylase Tpa1-like proline 4-hydroxylase